MRAAQDASSVCVLDDPLHLEGQVGVMLNTDWIIR